MIIKRNKLTGILLALGFAVCRWAFTASAAVSPADVPVFITLGQSNADGSAMFDPEIDLQMERWYESGANSGKMKIWYRSMQVRNIESNALGEAARHVVDGAVTDAPDGWMELWYRNEHDRSRTALNMVHGYGTYSVGAGTDCAQGRRGMEGAFGREFQRAFPASELYVIKLGVSGSFISSWANPDDDANWNYFYNNIFKPAITDLLDSGRRPRLAGVWWMQGCADKSAGAAYYEDCLRRLVERLDKELGFQGAHVYVGSIVKPGESEVTPGGSVAYGAGVREAQEAVARDMDNVEIVDTRNFAMQYEDNFGGYLHFNHAGVNAIGAELASRVAAAGPDGWAEFSTPGQWIYSGGIPFFVPAFGNPEIIYSYSGDEVTARLVYPGFEELRKSVVR